jgi:hypothetical protein
MPLGFAKMNTPRGRTDVYTKAPFYRPADPECPGGGLLQCPEQLPLRGKLVAIGVRFSNRSGNIDPVIAYVESSEGKGSPSSEPDPKRIDTHSNGSGLFPKSELWDVCGS